MDVINTEVRDQTMHFHLVFPPNLFASSYVATPRNSGFNNKDFNFPSHEKIFKLQKALWNHKRENIQRPLNNSVMYGYPGICTQNSAKANGIYVLKFSKQRVEKYTLKNCLCQDRPTIYNHKWSFCKGLCQALQSWQTFLPICKNSTVLGWKWSMSTKKYFQLFPSLS